MQNLPQPTEKFAAARALVVDDEPLLRWSVGETLRDIGLQVIEAGTPRRP